MDKESTFFFPEGGRGRLAFVLNVSSTSAGGGFVGRLFLSGRC